MKIIKRDGREVAYDGNKIINAVTKANERVDDAEKMTDLQIRVVEEKVRKELEKKHHTPSIEEIQDLVIHEIMRQQAFRVAQLYTEYRYKQMLVRRKNSTDDAILTLIEYENEDIKQENSNKNPMILSTQRDYIAGESSKDLTWRVLLPQDIVKAHEEGLIHFHDADYFIHHMHNCFSGFTEFVTSEGIKTFNDFKDGEEVTVLDKNGVWRQATVHEYGKQIMYDITFQAGRSTKIVTATKDHRWLLKDGSVTTDLSVGDVLIPLPEIAEIPVPESKSDIDAWCFGFIIGDGTDLEKGLQVRLCSDKIQYHDIFTRAGYAVRNYCNNGDIELYKKTKMSKQQFLTAGGWRYMSDRQKQMLFLGYYAADGSKDRTGVSTADDRIAEMIADISATCGYHISSHKVEIRDTNFKQNAQLHTFRFRRYQINKNCWVVKEIKSHDKADRPRVAWCVEEPVTHSFTLAGGMVTGNCCLINLEDMLQNGTVISETKIDTPNSIITACTVASQIIAQVASSQYGGQTFALSHLVPFVEKSRVKHLKRLKERFNAMKISYTEEQISYIVEEMVKDDIRSGIQTIQYQLLTLMTTNGQTPFVSMYININDVPEGRGRDDFITMITEVFRQRIVGIKNEKGIYVTAAFPKILYVLDENNINPDSPYIDLTILAAKCTAARMVPDYISAKIMREYTDGDVYGCMGCRSFLTKDRFTDVVGNIANANNFGKYEHHYWGRFNQGVVTINLVDVALSSGGNKDEFWKIFDERLELCHRALRCRHERLLGTPADVAPILWRHGALARLEKGEVIDKLLYNGYSTLSLGYAGLYEMCYYMTGKSHTDPEGEGFALQVMQHMNDATAKWKTMENIDYSLYGTPLESTTYRFAKLLQNRFGIIENVTDHNYITNSYHVNVREKIDAFTKLMFESKFQKLSPGGAISYVETPDMKDNIPALLAMIRFIYDNIKYAEFNSKSDYCWVCGYDGEIKIIEDENGKLIWECPNCKNRDQNKMNVARRTCGYIGTQFWNQGRTQEIRDRVIHLSLEQYGEETFAGYEKSVENYENQA